MQNHTTYLVSLFSSVKRKRFLKNIRILLKKYPELEKLYWVGTGISGTVPLGILTGIRSNLKIAMVRKETSNHSYHTVEGIWNDSSDYIIIDDLVASADTLKNIKQKLELGFLNTPSREGGISKCKHIILYNDYSDNKNRIWDIFPEATIHYIVDSEIKSYTPPPQKITTTDDDYIAF